MPGYGPFLLCDFHVHTRWSDGRLSVREVIDLYGQTGRFDVIAITDHILMKRDLLARAGKLASLELVQATSRRRDNLVVLS
jgi:predicted metal-dependent phosphoesterase TrpH